MRRIVAAIGGAAFGSLLLIGTAFAADPTPPFGHGGTTGTVAQVLGLSQDQIHDLREDGLTIAQIAERQKVEVQKVVDALVARWADRIDVRLQNGALTSAEAAALKAKLQKLAQDMVSSTEPSGMRGAAVGAGPNGNGNGSGNGSGQSGDGDGTCDDSGPHGRGNR
jgi:hypothetical protein